MKTNPVRLASDTTLLVMNLFLLLFLVMPLDSTLYAGSSTSNPRGTQVADRTRTAKGNFWVAPYGDDSNPGTEALPFATLGGAQGAIRAFLASQSRRNVVVNVRGGIYRLTEPLRFSSQDSPGRTGRVLYRAVPGETPVISGAVAVSGWEKHQGRIVKADLANIAPKRTRQLYVNGNRAVRARTQDYPSSFLPSSQQVDGEWIVPGIQFIFNPVLNPGLPDPGLWKNQEQIEAMIITQWKMSMCRLSSITPEKVVDGKIVPGLIQVQEPCWNNANVYRDDESGAPSIWSFWQVTRFENALEFLDEPGEWYLHEQNATLYYMPLWGEDIFSSQVELPQLETLIELAGTPDKPVENITFQGFTFRGATWIAPSSGEGYVADQSGFHLTGVHKPNYVGHDPEVTRTPGNISLRFASGIEFKDNIFEQLGAVAIDLVTGCTKNTIAGNRFRNLSSAAIQIGGVSSEDARPADSSTINVKNIVHNNLIYQTGQDYFDSAAIFVGFTQKTEISYNTILDVPWSGIAVGWGWGLLDKGSYPGLPGSHSGQWGTFDTPTVAGENKIIGNRIGGFLSVVWDGGAVYTTGQQGPTMAKGILIAYNVAHDKRTSAGGNTFYTDAGSRYVTLRSNASYNNPVGHVDFGPCPNPLDPLPYPSLCLTNIIPYGSDSGGCRTYGDILYTGNYWAEPQFFDICPYTDEDGISYPVRLQYVGNKTIAGEQDIPKGILRRAGSSLSK
jgi:hypothetical protein